MKNSVLVAMFTGATLLSAAAVADHNSVWGEGWASMPNDIHNTRIDTLGTDDDSFTDFVRYGDGADSVNRFADSTTSVAQGAGGAMVGGMGGGRR